MFYRYWRLPPVAIATRSIATPLAEWVANLSQIPPSPSPAFFPCCPLTLQGGILRKMYPVQEHIKVTRTSFRTPCRAIGVVGAHYQTSLSHRTEAIHRIFGSMYVSEKLPTYPSPNRTFCPNREVSFNVMFGQGQVGSFPETYIDPILL